jgi:hypothetical protein
MLTLLLMMLLNRVRGGGLWIGTYLRENLRVKPLFVVTPLVGLLALSAGSPWLVAITTAAAYLVWALPAWGRWFDLGNLPDGYAREAGKYADPLEKWIDQQETNDMGKMVLRHSIMLTVAAVMIAIAAQSAVPLVLAPLLVSGILWAYVVGWNYSTAPILVAELLAGFCWGSYIWLISQLN